MEPYERAADEQKRQGEIPFKALKTAGSIAGTAASLYGGGQLMKRALPLLSKYIPQDLKTAGSIDGTDASLYGGGQLMKRALPLLSKYIPQDLAIKGLNKIDPRFGKFIKKALAHGEAFDDIKKFIEEKGHGEEEEISDDRPAEVKTLENKDKNIEKLFISAKQGKTQGNKFLKYANQLIKSQDISDYEIFKNFHNWWHTKPSEKRGSPRAEFELFRREIGDSMSARQTTSAQEQQQGGQRQGDGQLDPELAQILQQGQAILQGLKGRT